MHRQRRHLSLTLALLIVLSSCSHAPPNLAPASVHAFYATRAIKVVDQIRDFAIDGAAVDPKVVSTADARAIVTWHQAIVRSLTATPAGWQAVLDAGLAELPRLVSPDVYKRIAPYVALGQALGKEIARG